MCVCASVYLRYFASDILKLPVILVFLGSTLSPLPPSFHQTMFFLFSFHELVFTIHNFFCFLENWNCCISSESDGAKLLFFLPSHGVVCSAAIWRPFPKNIFPSFHRVSFPHIHLSELGHFLMTFFLRAALHDLLHSSHDISVLSTFRTCTV